MMISSTWVRRLLLSTWLPLLSGACFAEPERPRESVEMKVRLTASSLIVVPVFVNGVGPFEFVLDTGTTITMVDEQVASQAGLSRQNRTTVVSVQGGQAAMETGTAASVMVEGQEVSGMTVGILHDVGAIPVKVHGVLGEDYLRHFDVLLDYAHSRMTLMTMGSRAEELICGERIVLALNGNELRGPANRPTMEILLPYNSQRVRLLLDTGTNALVLFGRGARAVPGRPEIVAVAGNAVSERRSLGGRLSVVRLRVGGATAEVRVLAVAEGSADGLDVEGLLPASAFRAVFLSHSGGYVVFDPQVRTEAQVAYYKAKLAQH